MDRLKLRVTLFLIYAFINIGITEYVYNCSGNVVPATDTYAANIKSARDLFTQQINLPEPEYKIQITGCYQAYAQYRNSPGVIILTEAVIKSFTTEEVAGMIGHELGHIKAGRQGQKNLKHWEIDIIGAKLSSKKYTLAHLNRLRKEYDNIFEKNKKIMYVFPFSLLTRQRVVHELKSRIDKVNELAQ